MSASHRANRRGTRARHVHARRFPPARPPARRPGHPATAASGSTALPRPSSPVATTVLAAVATVVTDSRSSPAFGPHRRDPGSDRTLRPDVQRSADGNRVHSRAPRRVRRARPRATATTWRLRAWTPAKSSGSSARLRASSRTVIACPRPTSTTSRAGPPRLPRLRQVRRSPRDLVGRARIGRTSTDDPVVVTTEHRISKPSRETDGARARTDIVPTGQKDGLRRSVAGSLGSFGDRNT